MEVQRRATRTELDQAIRSYGPWTASNIEVGSGIYTRPGDDPSSGDDRVRMVAQFVCDILGVTQLTGVRVADLGCLEGAHAIELALRGAEVVGIEGRVSNLGRAQFAAQALALGHCSFIQDDARNFTVEKYGSFDVVLCLGLLYHLDGASSFRVIQNLRETSRRMAIIDTEVSLARRSTLQRGGHSYEGTVVPEHKVADSDETRAARAWASLDNPRSFIFTRDSLIAALGDAGFTSVVECKWPQPLGPRTSRVQLIAFPGQMIDQIALRWNGPSPRYEAIADYLPTNAGGREAARLLIRAAGRRLRSVVRR